MAEPRAIKGVFRAKPTVEGAGVHLRRVFGFREVPQFDPFLLLDDFSSNHPDKYIKGFPWHPHRGIETITYVVAGDVEHGDSLGNSGVIHSGDVQWMTAGSGIIHQEMPKGDERGRMWGFQLWANLPASEKMMAPRYRDVVSADIPVVKLDNGITVKIICGEFQGQVGPARDIVINPQYLDIALPPGGQHFQPIAAGHAAFAYVFEGRGLFCGQKDPLAFKAEGENYFDLNRDPFVASGNLVLFGDGDGVTVSAAEEPVRFLMVSGPPLGEPVAWAGPIVMNTREELRTALDEYQNGTFIKNPAPGSGTGSSN